MSARVVSCNDCGNPMALASTGWGRCRQCGYESLRDQSDYIEVADEVLGDGAAPRSGAGLVSFINNVQRG